MSAENADQAKVVEMMRDARFCMLGVVTEDGATLQTRPMTPQEVTEGGTVWFFIDRTSDHARLLTAHPDINLAFSDSSSWLSVSGTARLVDDRERIDRLWNSVVEAWFPDGKDSPEVTLLRFDPTSAEYWDSPGGRVASAIAFVKAKVAGERYEGDSDTVAFP
jgi:general stress protein 26